MEAAAFRTLFPILEDVCWFATPSAAPAAQPVADRLRAELSQWIGEGLSWPAHDRAAHRAREGFAALTGFDAADVALVQSVAEGVSLIATSLNTAEVVIGALEYRSLLFPWLNQSGATVRTVDMPAGYLSSAAMVEAIRPQTDVVAVSWVQSATGSRIDLRPIRARCDEVGAALLVDGTQGVGVLDFHPDGRPDFLAVHGYKWLLAPRGAAWLAAVPRHGAVLRPLAPSNRSVPESWHAFYGGPMDLRPDMSRLDSSLSWLPWVGAEEAVNLMCSLATKTESHCLSLAATLRSELQGLGLDTSATELPSHVVTFDHSDARSLPGKLRDQGVQVTVRSGLVRVGLHYFNTESDLEVLLRVLGRSRKKAR